MQLRNESIESSAEYVHVLEQCHAESLTSVEYMHGLEQCHAESLTPPVVEAVGEVMLRLVLNSQKS